MAKNKKLDTKLRSYYKGAARKPTKVANEDEMKVIETALLECLPIRSTHSFQTTWTGQLVDLQMIVGLASCLRHLKRGQTRAIIFDDTAAVHTSGYLVEFCKKLNIPIVQASNLIQLAPKVDLKTLLVISLVDSVATRHDEGLHKTGDPKPKPTQGSIDKKSFNELVLLLQSYVSDKEDECKFKPPVVALVKSTGRSKTKKESKKGEKQSKRLQNLKTNQVGQKARANIYFVITKIQYGKMYNLRHAIKTIIRHCHNDKVRSFTYAKRFASSGKNNASSSQTNDESLLMQDLGLPGVHLDEIDKIMSDEVLQPLNIYYPNLGVDRDVNKKPVDGHNVMVIQPWIAYANFNDYTEPDLQLEECVSLGNTIHNWKVVDKRIVFANSLNRKQLLGPKAFDELKDSIQSTHAVSAVLFGVELLSAIQLATLEKELKLAVFDRFTVVLNIFRQHARTKEAKIQLALAELPYIKSHLREIHQSSEFSSSVESLKMLVGGTGEKFYQQRVNILKKREQKLKYLLEEFRKQREVIKKQRRRSDIPTVSVVGYTNCGKTTLIKYLTQDERLVPKDQLFATLDVSAHLGQLPSSRKVFYLDTVGFLSRIPLLLVEAFSATLRDVQESDLIVHVFDVTHPDHRLQYATVTRALESLKVSKSLLETRLTIGNKADLIDAGKVDTTKLPKCDLKISATNGINMNELVDVLDKQLMANTRHEQRNLRIENGGRKYSWLMKNATILECQPDEVDTNYLVCRVIMSPTASGRWQKQFGTTDFVE